MSDAGPAPARRFLEITEEHARLWAASEARTFAASLGFRRDEQERLALCVAEIASNTAKHAGRGSIELIELVNVDARTVGCRLRAEDAGPGIAFVDDALRDGFSEGRLLTPDVPLHERRGLGVGLGAVCRLLSDVRLRSGSGTGLVIEAVLWKAGSPPGAGRRPAPRTP